MKRILKGILILVGLVIAAAAAGLGWTHLALRERRAPLPPIKSVAAALASDADRPVRLSWINTASQDMPRSNVLDPATDPQPDKPCRMSHASFVLEWADGRILLVDTGMTEEVALHFGRSMQMFGGAGPITPHGSTAAQLGARSGDVAGVLLTHLHNDHVDGVKDLCSGRAGRLRIFSTPDQIEYGNYTTRPGVQILDEAGCVERIPLVGVGPLYEVPGFPGVRVFAAGGHTPDSQIVVAEVGAGDQARLWAFTGDIANALDGIHFDVAKPWLYSTFLVPEDAARMTELRRYLRDLSQTENFGLLVPHDEQAITATALPRW